MKKIRRLFGLAATSAALVIALAVPAQAVVFQGMAYNNALYENAENFEDRGAPGVGVGDVFYGVMNSQNIRAQNFNGPGGTLIWQQDSLLPGLDTLTGYFAHQIAAILPPNPARLYEPGNFIVISAPLAAGDPLLGPLAPGEVMRLYADTGTAYSDNDPGGTAGDIANAIDGPLLASLGLAGGYWYTVAQFLVVPDVYETFGGLNVIINNTGFIGFMKINDPVENFTGSVDDPFGLNNNVDFLFNSEIEGTGPGANWMLSSNDPARFYPIVPEPSTVLLLGAGLVGLGLWGRKRMVK